MKRLLPVLMGFAFLLLSSTKGWSGISFPTPTPPCKGSPTSSVSNIASWTDCVGTYTFANGDKYVGEFRLGRRNGQGTLTFSSGSKFVGEYKNGSRHGRGTFTYANGGVKEGIWENGQFIIEILSSQEPTVSSTTTQTPTSKPLIAYTNKRIALVVGNSKYKARPLDNPVRDARLIGNTLRQYGFRVTLVEDADYRKFRKALASFREELRSAGHETTALFYYSGHGMQYQGNNYLIPIGSELETAIDLDIETIRAERVQSAMASITGVKIILLDACRVSPFKSFFRSRGLGLAQMDAPMGTIIGYSTAPGKVARDGTGKNSPYALGLVKAIRMPGLTIEAVLKQTLNWVNDTTNGKQVPWYSSSLRGDFYFSKK